LRAERETLGVTVREVADTLNLSITVVQALEADAYDRLPGTVFARGYIRAYARLLDLDPVPLLDLYPDQRIGSDAHPVVHEAGVAEWVRRRPGLVLSLLAAGGARSVGERGCAALAGGGYRVALAVGRYSHGGRSTSRQRQRRLAMGRNGTWHRGAVGRRRRASPRLAVPPPVARQRLMPRRKVSPASRIRCRRVSKPPWSKARRSMVARARCGA
jgi:hypothetical protein